MIVIKLDLRGRRGREPGAEVQGERLNTTDDTTKTQTNTNITTTSKIINTT